MSVTHALAAPCATALDPNSNKAALMAKTLFNIVFSYDLHGTVTISYIRLLIRIKQKKENFPTLAGSTIQTARNGVSSAQMSDMWLSTDVMPHAMKATIPRFNRWSVATLRSKRHDREIPTKSNISS
jgi:hypothetical protein